MTTHLREQLVQKPLVVDFAHRTRHCGQPRSFFETIDESPCPIFVNSIRRIYRQEGGTIDAPPQLIAEVFIQLACDPQEHDGAPHHPEQGGREGRLLALRATQARP